MEETGGSFLSSPVELGVPAAPKGRFPHGGGVPGVPRPCEISWGIPNYGSRYFPAYCIPYFHPKRDPGGSGIFTDPQLPRGPQCSPSPGKGSRCPSQSPLSPLPAGRGSRH